MASVLCRAVGAGEDRTVRTSTIEIFSKDYWGSADEVAARLREEGPAHRAVLPDGVPVWVVTRDEEARLAFNHPLLSKESEVVVEAIGAALVAAGHSPDLSEMFSPSMLFRDPPAHTRLRRLLQRDFTARRVEQLRPRVEQITRRLLDDLPDEGCVDLIETFAFPLPVTVICELLGIADQGSFREWTAELMTNDPETIKPANDAMKEYFERVIAAKRAHRGDDLLSALIHPVDPVDKLADAELIATAFLLFVAGHETTMNLIGNMVRGLVPNPADWQALAINPGLVPGAVEEVLRYDSPVRSATHRVAVGDVDLGGTVIPEGAIVLILLGAANRDLRRHGSGADALDIRRGHGGGHLTFGHGIHFCLGAPLARMEATIALRELTARFPNARLAVPIDDIPQRPSVIMKGVEELRVELRPMWKSLPPRKHERSPHPA